MKNKIIYLILIIISLFSIASYSAFKILEDKIYQITFNSSGGSKVAKIEIKENTKITILPIPIRNGYQFKGWYSNNKLFDNSKPIKKNLVLTAKWQENNNITYIIKFDTLGGSLINNIIIEEGNILENIPIPVKETYKFKAWYYKNKEFDFSKPINSNLVLVAKYEKEID